MNRRGFIKSVAALALYPVIKSLKLANVNKINCQVIGTTSLKAYLVKQTPEGLDFEVPLIMQTCSVKGAQLYSERGVKIAEGYFPHTVHMCAGDRLKIHYALPQRHSIS